MRIDILTVVPELLDSLRNLRDMFDTEVGIPNTNTRKKGRKI